MIHLFLLLKSFAFQSILSFVIFGYVVESRCAEPSDVPDTVRVAAVQFISRWAKPDENRKNLEPLVREAAKNGAKIVVLPETAISSYMSHDIRLTWQVGDRPIMADLQGVSPKDVAETVPGESTRIFGKLAK
jgi:hypothetical protein